MFEKIEGRWRLTRYGQTIVAVVFLAMMGIGVAAYMSSHKIEGQDNSGDIKSILGLVATIVGVIWIKAGSQKNTEMLERNEQLQHRQIDTLNKVEGGIGTVARDVYAALMAEHIANIGALKEEHQRERHKTDGKHQAQLFELQLQLTTVNQSLKEKTELVEQLRLVVKDLTEKLAECASTSARAVGKLEGEASSKKDQADGSHDSISGGNGSSGSGDPDCP